MEVFGGVVQVLFMVLTFALSLLPFVIAVWLLIRVSVMSREIAVMRRQLGAIAEHSGAPLIPPPPARRRERGWLWAFVAVLAVVLLLMGLLFAVPVGWRVEEAELRPVGDSGSSSGSFPVPAMPEPAEDAASR